jgi:hypothetical protein
LLDRTTPSATCAASLARTLTHSGRTRLMSWTPPVRQPRALALLLGSSAAAFAA